MFYFTIYLNSISFSNNVKNIIMRIPLIDVFLRQTHIMGCNDYIINKGKYFFYFLFIVFFVCFIDIIFNRINFAYINDICNKEKDFYFFKSNKFLIDGINEGSFYINNNDKMNNINIMDNIEDDDIQLLKNNDNFNKNEINLSINEDEENI